MHRLHGNADDELDPEVPMPVVVRLDDSAEDGAEHGTADGREDDECDRELLFLRCPHVGDHAQRDGPARGGNAAQQAAHDDGAEVGRERAGYLPDWRARISG